MELSDLCTFFNQTYCSKFDLICDQQLLQLSSVREEVTLIPTHVSCKPRWHVNINTKQKWGNCMFLELCIHHNCTTAKLKGGREMAPQLNWSNLTRIPRKCNGAYELGSRQENAGKHPKILGDLVTAFKSAIQKLVRSVFILEPSRLASKARLTVA
jgi:hypothetical protein